MNTYVLSAIALAGLGSSPLLGLALHPEASPQGAALVQDGTPQKKPKEAPKDEVDPDSVKTVWEYLSGRYDANGDGKIDQKEYTRGETQFVRLDKDKNGFIEASDVEGGSARGQGRQGRRGRGPGAGGGQGRGGAGRGGAGRGGAGGRAAAPTEGAIAPDFELETLYPMKGKEKKAPESGGSDSKHKGEKKPAETPKTEAPTSDAEKTPKYETIKLSSWKGKKPVALIFGSYT